MFNCSSFVVVRHDRSGGRGGGVCVIVKKSYTIIPFNMSTTFDHLEVAGFDIVNAVPPVRVIVVYRPPYYDDASVRYASSLVEFFTECTSSRHRQHLIVGDLNLPRICWKNLSSPNETIHRMVFDFIVEAGFSQMVSSHTRGNNLLDVVLTDDDMLVPVVNLQPPIGFSDHSVIEFKITFCSGDTQSTSSLKPDTCIYQWHKTDFISMSLFLFNVD